MPQNQSHHHVFQGAPQNTSYTLSHTFCSPEYTFQCIEFPKLSFIWNSKKQKLYLENGKAILYSYRPVLLYPFGMLKIKNAVTSETICELSCREGILSRKYLAEFKQGSYTIKNSRTGMHIYDGNPKKGGIEIATLDAYWRGSPKKITFLKQNVDPAMIITIAVCVGRIERKKNSSSGGQTN
eukprot:NODE_127_length_17034_cov_0.369590.p10 type:complete len:182 gc:universal NODE_127_length_17034_cov_0.369590:2688-3233(+)